MKLRHMTPSGEDYVPWFTNPYVSGIGDNPRELNPGVWWLRLNSRLPTWYFLSEIETGFSEIFVEKSSDSDATILFSKKYFENKSIL